MNLDYRSTIISKIISLLRAGISIFRVGAIESIIVVDRRRKAIYTFFCAIMASSSSSSSLSSMALTLPLFLMLLLSSTMTTAFDLSVTPNNNPLLLSTTITRRRRTRTRIRSYSQCLPPNNKGSNKYSRRGEQLYMGGYYAEEFNNNNENNYDNEDRSKTHMIYGVRCIEKNKSFLIPTTIITETTKKDTFEVTVVGLQPLLKYDDDNDVDDGDLPRDDDDNDNYDFVSILLEQANRSLQQQNLRVLEIGADPIFSLALSRLISSTDTDDDASHSITICHPDGRRLRVLDHAYQFFNEQTTKKCSFQTVPLKDNDPLNVNDDDDNIKNDNYSSWIVFTSAKLVSKRLEEAMSIVAAKTIVTNNNYRIFVPSSIISNEQLKRYNYQEVLSSSNNNDKAGGDAISCSFLLEILKSK
jgi:hypothetical protein